MISIVWMELFKYDLEVDKQNILKMAILRSHSNSNSVISYNSIANSGFKLIRLLTNAMLIYLVLLVASILLGIIWHPFFY